MRPNFISCVSFILAFVYINEADYPYIYHIGYRATVHIYIEIPFRMLYRSINDRNKRPIEHSAPCQDGPAHLDTRSHPSSEEPSHRRTSRRRLLNTRRRECLGPVYHPSNNQRSGTLFVKIHYKQNFK